MISLAPFDRQSYLNLETFRKSGVGVKTPVWFVQDGDALFVLTDAGSGKVRRIRNNSGVNVAPCKVDGALLGTWLPASAREVKSREIEGKVDRLMGKKYGLMKAMFALAALLRGRRSTVLEIKVME